MRDLDDDCVDREIYDEEIRSRQNQHEPTCRGQTLRVLDSNPLQVLLYCLVLLDAGVVIAEILIDLHAMRSQYRSAVSDLRLATDFLKKRHAAELGGYNGTSIHFITDVLDGRRRPPPAPSVGVTMTSSSALPDMHSPARHAQQEIDTVKGGAVDDDDDYVNDTTSLGQPFRRRRSVAAGSKGSGSRAKPNDNNNLAPGEATSGGADGGENIAAIFILAEDGSGRNLIGDITYSAVQFNETKSQTTAAVGGTAAGEVEESAATKPEDGTEDDQGNSDGGNGYTYAERLLKIAHLLHYVGIGILAFFVVQVLLKVYGMGREFFRKKLEMFDAVIVLTSFSLDLLFIEGITGKSNEEAIALLIIFLLWRILRIINGIIVTSQKRQDLRIQLQKRARRRAEKKIEYLEDDKNWKEREITNLRRLCSERGASEDEIAQCKPRRRTIFQKMDTSMGLSSIATLSLGLSMSMAGAGRAVMRSLGPGHQQALQQFFPILPTIIQAERGKARPGAASSTADRPRQTMSGFFQKTTSESSSNCQSTSKMLQNGSIREQDTAKSVPSTLERCSRFSKRLIGRSESAVDTEVKVAENATTTKDDSAGTNLPQHNGPAARRLQRLPALVGESSSTIVPDVVIHVAADSTASTPSIVSGSSAFRGRGLANDVVRRQMTVDCSSHDSRIVTTALAPPARNSRSYLQTSGASSSSLPQLSFVTGNGSSNGVGGSGVGGGGGSHVMMLRDFTNTGGNNNLSLGALHDVGPEGTLSNLVRTRGNCRPCHDLSTAVSMAIEHRPPRFGTLFRVAANNEEPSPSDSLLSSPSAACVAHDDRATLLQNEVVVSRDHSGSHHALTMTPSSVEGSNSSLSERSHQCSPRGSLGGCGSAGLVVNSSGIKVKETTGRGRLDVLACNERSALWSKSDDTQYFGSTEDAFNWNESTTDADSTSTNSFFQQKAGGVNSADHALTSSRRLSVHDDVNLLDFERKKGASVSDV